MVKLQRPLIILGSVRSGTTLLGNLLKHHPDVAYWEEPKHIWRHRHAYRRHDVLTERDAAAPIKKYIHNQFSTFLEKSGRTRFVEKTPSNCLRVPFIRAIFPDAQFVHLIRDGRAASVSAMVQWQNDFLVRNNAPRIENSTNTSFGSQEKTGSFAGKFNEALLTIRKFFREKHLFSGGIWFFWEAPAYVPAFLRVFARKLTSNRSFLWGTRFPGIQEFHRSFSLVEVCAMQWALSVQSVLVHTRDLPADQYLEVYYEDLIANPVETIREVLEFANLPSSEVVINHAQRIVRDDLQSNWRDAISDVDLMRLEWWLRPYLTQFHYDDFINE